MTAIYENGALRPLGTVRLEPTRVEVELPEVPAGASDAVPLVSAAATSARGRLILTPTGIAVNPAKAVSEVCDELASRAAEKPPGTPSNENLPLLASQLGQKAGSEQDIINANARIKSAAAPRPVPSQPTGLELTMGDEDGELTGQCEGQPRIVDVYEIQFTLTDPNLPTTAWQHAAISQKSLFEIKNLPTGQKVWVRIRATNTSGTSTWSDPACKRVP